MCFPSEENFADSYKVNLSGQGPGQVIRRIHSVFADHIIHRLYTLLIHRLCEVVIYSHYESQSIHVRAMYLENGT